MCVNGSLQVHKALEKHMSVSAKFGLKGGGGGGCHPLAVRGSI